MVSVTGSLLSFLGEPEAESLVPSSIVSWRIILAVCMRVRSSFLPVFSVSPDLSYPTLSLSLFTTSLSLSWLLQSSAWSSLVSYCGWHRFHDLAVVLYWIMTSDSQSSYSGRDTLLYSSVGDFWVVCPARSGCLFAVGFLGSIPRGRSHSSSEFLLGCLFAFIFVGQRCFQLRVRSAKWADSPRASSQVNGLSSREFKTRSGLTVRVHLRRSTAGPARITIRVHFRSQGGFAFRGDYWSGGSITGLTNIRNRS